MTDVALKEYLERRIDDLDRRIMERFVNSDQSVAKAERTMNERLNSMNEFRDALKDQANRMATRIELDLTNSRVEELRRDKSRFDGGLLVLSGGVSLVTSILTILALLKFIK
jgi:hypothetical protein